jgi:hypothetical protein
MIYDDANRPTILVYDRAPRHGAARFTLRSDTKGCLIAEAGARMGAESVSVSSTVSRSNVERLITFSTSAVAVCCRLAELIK